MSLIYVVGMDLSRNEAKREVKDLLEWLNEHASYRLDDDGMVVRVRCPSCGDAVCMSSGLALVSTVCTLCGAGRMALERHSNGKRYSRARYTLAVERGPTWDGRVETEPDIAPADDGVRWSTWDPRGRYVIRAWSVSRDANDVAWEEAWY